MRELDRFHAAVNTAAKIWNVSADMLSAETNTAIANAIAEWDAVVTALVNSFIDEANHDWVSDPIVAQRFRRYSLPTAVNLTAVGTADWLLSHSAVSNAPRLRLAIEGVERAARRLAARLEKKY